MGDFRHEYKYMIHAPCESVLAMRCAALLEEDRFYKMNRQYTVRSLYFDDYQNSCLHDNENGVTPRSKFRIRYYNHDSSKIRLEKKSKAGLVTCKESCSLTQAEYEALLRCEYPDITPEMPSQKKKLLLEMRLKALIPKVIVSYERLPYVYPVGNVRITFDRGITSSSAVEDFLSGTYRARPILPTGTTILEVKWDGILPAFIRDMLQIDTLQWCAFSKYSMCRRLCL